MALQKIEVPLVISGGIDTKTDRKIVPDNRMIKTENVDFSKLGTLKKSKGTTRLTANTNTSDDINDISSSIFSHNNEIVVLGKQRQSNIYSYNLSDDEWKDKSIINEQLASVPCDITIDENSADYLNCPCSSLWEFPLAGFKIFATIDRNADGTTPFRLTKIDYATGEEQVFYPDSENDSYEIRIIGKDDATSPIFWLIVSQLNVSTTNDNVLVYTFNGDVGQIGSQVTIAQDTGAFTHYPVFDGIIVDGILFYAASVDKTELEIGYVNASGAISSSSTYSVTNNICIFDIGGPFVPYFHPNISCYNINNHNYVSFVEYDYLGNNRNVYLVGFNQSTFAVEKAEAKIIDKTVNGSVFYRVDIITPPIPSNSDTLVLAASGYDVTGKYVKTDLYFINYFSSLTVLRLTSNGSINNTEIASKGFKFGILTELSSVYYVMITSSLLSNTSTFSLVKFTIVGANDERTILGKFFTNKAIDTYSSELTSSYLSSYLTMGTLNPILEGLNSKYFFPCIVKADLIGVPSSLSRPTFIYKNSSVSIDFNGESNIFAPTRLSQSTHLSGSIVREYDGSTLRSSGFTTIPKASVAASTSANPLPDGNHQYKLIYVYSDVNGESHRSEESLTIDVTTSTQAVTITISPILSNMLDNQMDSLSAVWIYRALTDTGGPFYFVVSLPPTTTSYIDISADSSISSNETIYTNGGVLSNSQVPPMKYIASGLNRLFGVSIEDRNKIYYSQKRIVENSIEWSEALYFRVDGHGKNIGEAVGVENLDDKMIILKDDSILYISGDGPLPTGAQNTFTDPVVVSQEIGCNEVKSIVATPIGIMFKGKKGIYIVDRALAVKYIGAAVEEYNSETINGSDVSKIRNEVYFQTDNRLMIYNYLQDKWSTNTYLGGKSICIWQDQLTSLKSDGFVYYQNESVYTDNLADISMKVTTPWYKLKGTTGFGRLYEIIVYGEYKSDHTLNIRVYYDYDETDYGDYTFDVESMNIYEFSVKPSKQKCQSFKIEIWDSPTGGSGESYELTGISVRIGAKKGFYKLSDNNKG